MRIALVLLWVALCPAFASDADFNGRWNISTPSTVGRGWWLEVQGAGAALPRIRFVSAYAGDLNVPDEVSLQNGELTFGFRFKQRRQPGGAPESVHSVYKARIVGAELVGTSEIEGSNRPQVKWVGARAPEIKDKDDGTWREGQPIQLFNGKDLSGWHPQEKDREFTWTVEDGVLKAPGRGTNAVSDRKFWNFKLHIEFRMYPRSNSGLGLRNHYEIQILDDYGQPPDIHSNGALYSRVAPRVNASKPAGEWQTDDITLIGRYVTVILNGTKVLDKQEIEGFTAIARDVNEADPGPLALQGDHGAVDFRNIVITPLLK
jgi:hypothetical protein